jgi:hypothetical protein
MDSLICDFTEIPVDRNGVQIDIACLLQGLFIWLFVGPQINQFYTPL